MYLWQVQSLRLGVFGSMCALLILGKTLYKHTVAVWRWEIHVYFQLYKSSSVTWFFWGLFQKKEMVAYSRYHWIKSAARRLAFPKPHCSRKPHRSRKPHCHGSHIATEATLPRKPHCSWMPHCPRKPHCSRKPHCPQKPHCSWKLWTPGQLLVSSVHKAASTLSKEWEHRSPISIVSPKLFNQYDNNNPNDRDFSDIHEPITITASAWA